MFNCSTVQDGCISHLSDFDAVRPLLGKAYPFVIVIVIKISDIAHYKKNMSALQQS
jgi:hypothetical protein